VVFVGDLKVGEEFKNEFEKVLREFEERIKKLVDKVEELLDRGDVREAYRLWREGSRDILRDLKGSLKELEKAAKGAGKGIPDADELKSIVNEVLRDVSNYMEKLFKRFEGIGAGIVVSFPSFDRMPRAFIKSFKGLADFVDDMLREVSDVIEEVVRGASKRVSEVVSARIGVRELEVIDKLIDVGIFRSRSEAVAYFVKKGIEASKELIEKALDQAKRIMELRESIKREFMGSEGEEKS
jgi:Arc/MetJ-type ribon-helix-helix transcriptional regulator